ncbi:hypothetical protein TMatcc_001377 [Talaromyces marneffei ATCC 18224]
MDTIDHLGMSPERSTWEHASKVMRSRAGIRVLSEKQMPVASTSLIQFSRITLFFQAMKSAVRYGLTPSDYEHLMSLSEAVRTVQ